MRKMAAIVIMLLLATCAYAVSNADMTLYEGDKYRYRVYYPVDWRLYDRDNGVVVFKKPVDAAVYPSSVNIQTIYTSQADGEYVNVKELMDAFKESTAKYVDQAQFSKRQPITLIDPDGNEVHGEEIMVQFVEHGQRLKHWQIMVMTNDGKLFQAWAYRAPEEYYDADLPMVKKMLQTWDMQ